LHEVAAPSGYEVTTDITFTIKDGKLVNSDAVSDGNTVTMVDDMKETDVKISKANVFGDEVKGAQLTLTGKDLTGRDVTFDIDNVVLGKDAELKTREDGTKITWVSGSEGTFVKKLNDGTYTLHEVAAPSGYEVTTDITFTIRDGKLVDSEAVSNGNTVTMVDDMTETDVKISKQNVLSEELKGAKLTLTGKDFNGNAVVFNVNNVELGKDAELVTKENGTELTWISGTESTNVKKLNDGSYVLHEVAAPDGYEVTTDITFYITDGKVMGTSVDSSTNTVTMIDNMTTTDVEISKSNVFSEEVKGAELTLTGKDRSGNDVTFDVSKVKLGEGAELVTKENGTSLTWISGTESTFVKDLKDGTYTLHEVAAPSGYAVTTDITFTIENGEVKGTNVNGHKVTMIDDMNKLDVNISKANVLGEELAGASLTLTGIDFTGKAVNFDINDVVLGSGASLTSGSGTELAWVSGSTATLVKNLNDGTYVLHEAAAPDGYVVTTDITFTISDGKLVNSEAVSDGNTVTMIDNMITDVQISKKNTFGDEVKGAEITLTGKDEEGSEVVFDLEKVVLGEGAELVSDANGTSLTWKSGNTSTFVKGLADGTYTLHEVAAPSGYEVTTDITFTIKNGMVSGDTGVTGNTVTLTDDMTKKDVTISKQNVFSEEIKGARLTLTGTDMTGRKVEFNIDNVVLGKDAELVTRENGNELVWISGSESTQVKGLTDGTYTLHEVAAPSGYEVTTDITFTIENGQVTGSDAVSDGSTVTMIDDMTVTDVEISKANIFSDEISGARLTLTGKDFRGQDVTFDVSKVKLGEGAELVTSENGKELVWISGSESTFVKDLTDGTYVLHEVAAPSGYEVTTDITFTIENGEITGTNVDGHKVTLIDDMKVTTVEFSKQDTLGKELEGAELTLTGTDLTGRAFIFNIEDVVIGNGAKLVTDKNGTVLTWVSGKETTFVKNLTDGIYTLHEVAAPNGYKVTTDIVFTIKDGKLAGETGVNSDSSTVTMIDEAIATTTATTAKQTTTTTKATTTKATTKKADAPKTG
ncbi:MAG: hypothetical protein IKH82_01610, partial [Clostridiales bacterium]|nr:hypothetical protein [Clostridiales bacterium]